MRELILGGGVGKNSMSVSVAFVFIPVLVYFIRDRWVFMIILLILARVIGWVLFYR